jgi:UDP-GlcNAc:undecaprenyl-phosphate GlcNAc-1-phosphate transferase
MTWLENDLLDVSLKAFAVSVVLTPILRDIFRSYNVVDRPGFRRVHVHPIPRIGGIPIAIAYCVALLTLNGLDSALGFDVWRLLPGAAIVFLTGLIDDFWNLRPIPKLLGQIAAAVAVYSSGLSIQTLGTGDALPVWLNFPLTIFWLLLTTNALNLIDGLDGLCGGIGLLATLTMFGAALLHGNNELAYATLPLACALCGFLFYNVNPATVFLGDSGALLIGFLLGCYGMIWTQKTSTLFSILVPLVALSVPLLDVAVAIVRRALRRQPIFSPDQAHIHHRLLARGLTPANTVLVLYLFAALAAGLALLLTTSQAGRFRNLLLAILAAAFFFGVRELRYKEFRFFGQMFFGGELQQSLQAKLKMDKLGTALAATQTLDAWWKVLNDSAAELGWVKLSWMGPRGIQETTFADVEPAWTFLVPLEGGMGTLRVDGGEGESGITLSELASVIRKHGCGQAIEKLSRVTEIR